MTPNNPKVSITVVNYNHGKWLAECLESIITQEVNFPFEVIIGDDASTDKISIEIIEEYAKKYPSIIKAICRPKNVGPVNNYLDVVDHACGEYIAHIDADDYMLPGKIKSQVEFLDQHPNYNIASHRMAYLTKTSNNTWKKIINNDNYPMHGTIEDLIKYGTYFPHSSKMYRRSAIITRKTSKPLIDYFFHLEHSIGSKIYYSNEVLGCYRIHENGISKDNKWSLLIHEGYENAFDRALDLGIDKELVERSRCRHHQARALTSLRNKDYDTFKKFGLLKAEFLRNSNLKSKLIHYCTYVPNFAYYLLSLVDKYKVIVRG